MTEDREPTVHETASLIVPHSVDDAAKPSVRIPAGWDNAKSIKTSSQEFTADDIHKLAEAIYKYMITKNLAEPAPSWQDYIFISMLRDQYMQSKIDEYVASTGASHMEARLSLIYANLPKELRVTDEDVAEIIARLEAQKPPYEDVTTDEIVIEVAKANEREMTPADLEKKNLLADMAKVVDAVIKKHERNKWIIFVEEIVAGLITNGLYDLLRVALESLIGRAPYPEAQIYEVESDVLRTIDLWTQGVPSIDDFNESEANVSLWFALHCMCVLAVLGTAVPNNPLLKAEK